LLTKLKQKFQLKIAGLAKKLWNAGLTPDIVSGLGIVLAVLCAATYVRAKESTFFLLLAPVLLLLSGFCDALDGAMARLGSQETVFGSFIDSILDRYSDTIVYSSILIGDLCEIHWGLTALIGSLLVSYTRAKGEVEGVKMEAVGLMERPERILVIATATFVTVRVENALNWGIFLLAVLTNLTVIQRIIHFYKLTNKASKEI
jgi:archaetidylinositol phosphate synthase